ncbi:MAG: circadian clock KaiB family protein [Nibricoccus sp.]
MTAKRAAKGGKAKGPPAKKTPAKTRGRSTAAEFEALIKKTVAGQRYVLKLYVTGTTPRSAQAVANIRALCDEHLVGRYDLEVVDIYQQPGEASGAQIIAAPTLVKQFPAPAKRMVGDLSNRARVMLGLDLQPSDSPKEKSETKWVAL